MLLSRRNQLLLEFSFWNEPLPRQGPNIYELRTYKLKVRPTEGGSCFGRGGQPPNPPWSGGGLAAPSGSFSPLISSQGP